MFADSIIHFRDAQGICYSALLIGAGLYQDNVQGFVRIPCSRMPKETLAEGGS